MAIVFQIHHDSYRICCGRNMPPFYSFEKFTQILSVSILVKWMLVVLGFNATLTAKVISWRSVTHMRFLAFSHQY